MAHNKRRVAPAVPPSRGSPPAAIEEDLPRERPAAGMPPRLWKSPRRPAEGSAAGPRSGRASVSLWS